MNALPIPLHVSLTGKESHSLTALVYLMRRETDECCQGTLAVVTALTQTLLALALRHCGDRHDEEGSMSASFLDATVAIIENPTEAHSGCARSKGKDRVG